MKYEDDWSVDIASELSVVAMKLMLLSLVFMATGCATSPKSEPGVMTILHVAKNGNLRDPSRWKRDASTVTFAGTLVKGDCELFSKTVDQSSSVLRVNSSGGDAFEGLCIAREMRKRKFNTTVVEGLCVSACANYLFLASTHKVIANGLVGFHGNITALMNQDPKNVSLRHQLSAAKMDPDEIKRVMSVYSAEQRRNSALEKEFLREVGVSQSLFDRTQIPDKDNVRKRASPKGHPTGRHSMNFCT